MEARKLKTSQPSPFQLSLRVRHPSMDPAVLSREFSLEAEHSFRAGEPRHSRSGLAHTSVHADTYWLATLDLTASLPDISFGARPGLAAGQRHMSASVAQNLGWALGLSAIRLQKKHAALLHQIRAEDGEVSLLVALSAVAVGSFSLAPEVGRIFADLGITVEFEFTSD
jgi:hypothetical protein